MKNKIIIGLFFLFIKMAIGQQLCLPAAGGIPAGNEAPGCRLCTPIYQGSTAGFTATAPFSDGFPCGTIENNQFFSVLADSTGNLQGTMLSSNCQNGQGTQMIIYDQQFNPVSNCFSTGGTQLPGNISASGLTPGEFYWVMADGFAGDICDILIIISGASFSETDATKPMEILPDLPDLCPGAEVCYSIDSVGGAIGYHWLIPDNASIISGGDSLDLEVCVKYLGPGAGEIRVFPISQCSVAGRPAIEPIEVFQNTIDTVLCPGEFINFNGHFFDATMDTTVLCPNLTSGGSCDSIYLNLDLTMSDLSPPEVTCILDTFLRGVALKWTNPIGVIGYEIFVENNLVSTQFHDSYLHIPPFSQDSVNITILPFNSRNCNFIPAEITCFLPKTSNLVEKTNDSEVTIFPNPTNDFIEIQTEFHLESTTIFDLSGKLILEYFDSKIDLSNYNSGIYFLKIKTKKSVFVKKIMKK